MTMNPMVILNSDVLLAWSAVRKRYFRVAFDDGINKEFIIRN